MRQLNWRHHWQVGYANFPVLYPLFCFRTLPKNFASPSLELAFTGSLILRLSSSCFSAASSACQSNLARVQTHSWWQSSRRAMKRRCHQSSAEGVSHFPPMCRRPRAVMSETGSGGSIAKAAHSPSQSGPRIKPNSVSLLSAGMSI